jgi:hypothetical protein
MLEGKCNYSQDRSFLKVNEENPALVLSKVHSRTSARDGPMFGSKGPSMNTSSLELPASQYFLQYVGTKRKASFVTVFQARRKVTPIESFEQEESGSFLDQVRQQRSAVYAERNYTMKFCRELDVTYSACKLDI